MFGAFLSLTDLFVHFYRELLKEGRSHQASAVRSLWDSAAVSSRCHCCWNCTICRCRWCAASTSTWSLLSPALALPPPTGVDSSPHPVHVEYNIQPTPSLLLSPSPSLSRNLDTDTLIHCRSALRLACASRLHASFRFTLPASACLGSVLLVIVYIRLA